MTYMLDTNICSFIIKNKPSNVTEKLRAIPKNDKIVLSSIVVSELMYGAYKKSKRLVGLVNKFISFFEIVDFDINAAVEYGRIRVNLEKRGIVIGAYDMQIAAHAKSIRAVLVTNNTREFKRIEGLEIEDWTQ